MTTFREHQSRAGKAGRGASKARDPEKMRIAGKKGAAIRWTRAALDLIESGDAIVRSTAKSRAQVARWRRRLANLMREVES